MRITETRGNYFYFSLDDKDFEEYGFKLCKRFLNAFKKEFICGGETPERFWLKRMKAWSISNACRKRFDLLLDQYFNIQGQGELFGGIH